MADVKELLKELAIKVLEEDGNNNGEATEAPVVESVETESLKTKASSGADDADVKTLLKELAIKVLEEDKANGDTATEAPVVESVETESLKTKASSGQ